MRVDANGCDLNSRLDPHFGELMETACDGLGPCLIPEQKPHAERVATASRLEQTKRSVGSRSAKWVLFSDLYLTGSHEAPSLKIED